jgi:hypothetical protein
MEEMPNETTEKILEDMKCTEKVENVCCTPSVENPELVEDRSEQLCSVAKKVV